MKKSIYLFTLLLFAMACGKNANLVVREDAIDQSMQAAFDAFNGMPILAVYSQSLPSYLSGLGMEVKQADDKKAGLGRVLFYDKNLSKDRRISCASCHKQELAFSDDVALSIGIEGRQTARNSLPLANVASFSAHYSNIGGKTPLLFWDERVPNVSAQSRQTFANPLEMGMDMSDVLARIKEAPYYLFLWNQVYGNFEPTEDQVLECLQEFVGAMGCHKTKLDEAMQNALGDLNQSGANVEVIISPLYYGPADTTINVTPVFSPSEDRGRVIFVNNCSKCHSPIRPFQEVFVACNGLEMNYLDKGLGKTTGNPADDGVFKSPSLRNIALTAPYMHDGRFKTLEEVIDFYSEKVQPHPNLHPKMLHNGDRNLHLSSAEKQDLIAFLNTLTDNSIASDSRFSNPFK